LKVNSLDAGILLAYLAIIFSIGIWVGRRNQSEADYFLAGRRLPWYVICLSMFSTNISSNHFIGFNGLAYSQGMAMASFEWFTVLGTLALAFIFLPYYRKARVVTLPEFLERRYDERCRILLSAGALLLYVFMELSSLMYTGALALDTILGIDFMWALILIIVFVGIYTTYGGLTSVVWVDSFQAIVLYVGGGIVAAYALLHVGGLRTVMADIPEKFHTVLPANDKVFPWPGIFLTGLPLLAVWAWATNQVIVQRALAARSDWDARMGTLCVGFLKLFGPFFMVLPGIVAFRLFPNLKVPDSAFPTLVRELVPHGLSGIVLAGLIAALMSTADSLINSCSTLFTHDFYARFINPRASQQRIVLVGRIASVAIMLIVLVWAPVLRKQESIVLYAINLLGFLASPFVAVFAAGIFTQHATPTAAFVSILASLPVSLGMNLAFPDMSYLYRIPIVFVFCLVVIAVVSAFTKPKPLEAIEGLLWNKEEVFRGDAGLLVAQGSAVLTKRLPLYKDYRLVAVVVTLLTVAMFCVFF
jgi:SSS family solute:Na+ symporter